MILRDHPVFTPPPDEAVKVWRYLDLAGFVSLLSSRSLFFRRADKFRDRLEGSFSRANLRMRPEVYQAWEEEHRQIAFTQMAAAAQRVRSHVYINCWHMSERESAGMWDAYAGSNLGIAIQSTYSRLIGTLEENETGIYAGVVNYIDYEQDWMPEGNLFYPFVYKDLSFQHERELRCLIPPADMRGQPPYEVGWNVEVDMQRLIENVVIAPYAQPWFTDVVESLIEKYDVNIPVRTSILGIDPVF